MKLTEKNTNFKEFMEVSEIMSILLKKREYRRKCKRNKNTPDVVLCNKCNWDKNNDNSWCCMSWKYNKKYLQNIFMED